MKLVELAEFLVKELVEDKESISVKQFEDDDEHITIQILVKESDMGLVIGKNGSIANAIRTIIQASSYANKLPRVKINIDSY